MRTTTRLAVLATSLSSALVLNTFHSHVSLAGTDEDGCPNKINYAVQHQVEKALGENVILFPENFSPEQRGQMLFLIRTKYRPWAQRLPYGCVRTEWLGYLRTVKDGIEALGNNPDGKTDFDLADEIEPTLPQPPK